MSWDFSTEPDFEEKLEWMRGFVRTEIFPLEVLQSDDATVMRIIRDLQKEHLGSSGTRRPTPATPRSWRWSGPKSRSASGCTRSLTAGWSRLSR